MRNYSQPDFYHFSQDSILLAKVISQKYPKPLKHILELGAGSGVVSFELLDLGFNCESLLCVELQYDFYEHFEFNRLNFAHSNNVQFLHTDFLTWETSMRFDLIYFNPPYYLLGEGIESKDVRTLCCRFISRDAFIIWLERSRELLAIGGALVFCLNQQASNRLDPVIKNILGESIQVENQGQCSIYFFSN